MYGIDISHVVLAALILMFLWGQILELRQHHSHEIYAIWYVFSFFGLIFFVLYLLAEKDGKEVSDALGPSSAETLKAMYGYLTRVGDELRLVGAFVYLAIAPQLLTYVLAGLSGSAAPPKFVRQIGTLAIWSVIKFMAGLSGILLSQILAKLSLGKQVSSYDFFHAMTFICVAFFLAVAYHRFDRQFELALMPGCRVCIRVPLLFKIHKIFTQYTQEHSDAPETPEREWPINVLGLITLHLRGPIPLAIHDLLPKRKPQQAASSDAERSAKIRGGDTAYEGIWGPLSSSEASSASGSNSGVPEQFRERPEPART